MSPGSPAREPRFTFGLWTVGNPGRDPFGEPTRPPLDPVESVERLAELGAWGVSLHDNDLVPLDASAAERDRIVARFTAALERTGMSVAMATTNLFTHPVFKDGAFTANSAAVRRFALQKTMRAMDLGAELGAEVYVFWGGREGVDTPATKDVRTALERYREAIDFLCEYALDQGYSLRFALEPKPNEPRGDLFLPTVGHALHFISMLEHPEMVGVNPEVAHERMAGLSFEHAVAQALWAGKLFHIDLNGQRAARFDQDLRFGQDNLKDAFFLVKLLEEAGYEGPRHFDAHPMRGEDADGVWAFAEGCMRTYRLLVEKVEQFAADAEIQDALREAEVTMPEPLGPYSPELRDSIAGEQHDLAALASRRIGGERLDQLVVDLLLGAR